MRSISGFSEKKDLDQLVDKDGREFSPLLCVQGDWDWEGVVTKREFLFGSPYQSFAEDIYEGKRTPDFSIYVTAAEEVA